MAELPSSGPDPSEVIIQLIDSSSDLPLKTWRFSSTELITIGRSSDRHVEVSDAYVSRHHASLMRRDGNWILVSLGRNGVLIGSQIVNDHPLEGDARFRLGSLGPWLRFHRPTGNSPIESLSPSETLMPDFLEDDETESPAFHLDQKRLSEDVQEIVEGDYFHNLQEAAKRMREKRMNG